MDTVNVWQEDAYARYANYCDRAGYCPPWHPYIGPDYGSGAMPKFMYCGGAAWWSEDHEPRSLSATADATRQFVEDGMYDSPFWRLFDRVGRIALPGLSNRREFSRHSVWTNLSKTGLVQQTAPPDKDTVLRALDVHQMEHELDQLKPDIIVCVSGSIVPSTGYAVFNDSWTTIAGAEPNTEDTWLRFSPWGGVLLWTMHPAYKSESWMQSVEMDLRTVIGARKFRK